MKRIILTILILLAALPACHAEDVDIPLGDYPFLNAHLEDVTIIDEDRIPSGCVTTLHNLTFPYENAHKITYTNNESKTDYLIIWQCNASEEYYVLSSMHDLSAFHSDYTQNRTGVMYVEVPDVDEAYGIILDTQNITYTEEDLVHDILGLYNRGLTSSQQPNLGYVK